jgi:hypothetical protein
MTTSIRYTIALVAIFACTRTSTAQSGHADIVFWYEGGKIVTQTANGLNVGTGTFATSGLFQQFDGNPGFASEADVGHGIGGGDVVAYNVLEALRYWNGSSFAPAANGVALRIENNLGPEAFIDNASGVQLGSPQSPYVNFIDQAGGNGDFHGHIDYFLEPRDGPTPAFGAYGVKLSLSTSASGIADSDPFFIVFNFGLDSTAFTTAVNAFGDLLVGPELPGDFNDDGHVNLADYTVWRDNLGGDETLGVLSGNGDGGLVTGDDYQLWKTHFGTGSGGPLQSSTQVVPEPASVWLAILGASGIVVAFRSTTRR